MRPGYNQEGSPFPYPDERLIFTTVNSPRPRDTKVHLFLIQIPFPRQQTSTTESGFEFFSCQRLGSSVFRRNDHGQGSCESHEVRYLTGSKSTFRQPHSVCASSGTIQNRAYLLPCDRPWDFGDYKKSLPTLLRPA